MSSEQPLADRNVAIAAETLYLINLMLLPGIGFLLLLGLKLTYRGESPLALNHLSQTLGISLIGGSAIVIVVALFFILGGGGPYVWLWVVFYFTFIHSSLIFMGVFGFIKALNCQHFRYPLLGGLFRA